MLSRLPSLVTAPGRALTLSAAVAATALLSAAPSALAATPLTGETLAGTGTSGVSVYCAQYPYLGTRGAGTFNIPSGTATGPYPGSFSESGSFAYSGIRQPFRLGYSGNFTITSGTTAIAGRFFYSYPGVAFIGAPCGSPIVSYFPATYLAVIAGVTYQGTVIPTFRTGPVTSLTETFR